VLLDAAMIDAFLAGVGEADIAAAMVERAVLMRAYPESRRTWLKFREGAWSGANLFWLGGANAKHALQKWREIEQDRKKGWKIVLSFGPALLLAAGLRILTIHQAIARAGRKLGISARIVSLPYAEACIDADKPEGYCPDRAYSRQKTVTMTASTPQHINPGKAGVAIAMCASGVAMFSLMDVFMRSHRWSSAPIALSCGAVLSALCSAVAY
jgi:hypothetical protein